jgi:hypothetical protein
LPIDSNTIASRYFELSSTVFDDCVHAKPLRFRLKVGDSDTESQKVKFSSRLISQLFTISHIFIVVLAS